MADRPPQTYANHRRFVPGYHFVLVGLVLLLFAGAVYRLVTAFSLAALLDLGTFIALSLTLFYARIFALKAQDRVIRLEERLRLEKLLPPELLPRVPELRRGQLIALRFAGDEELADLVSAALTERLTNPQIKRRIKSWRPDYFRV